MDIRAEIIKLQNNYNAPETEFTRVAKMIISELDANGDGKLSKADNLNSVWNNAFGITNTNSLDEVQISNKLDKIELPEGKITDNFDTAAKLEEAKKQAKIDGAYVQDILLGSTANYIYDGVNEILEGLTKETVVSFIKGYVDERGWQNTEGLIEQLDDEHESGAIEMSTKKHVIKMMLERAEETGKTGNEHYKKLEMIYKSYTEGSMKGATDFTQRESFNFGHIIAGAAAGGTAGAYIGAPFGGIGAAPGAVVGGIIGGFGTAATGLFNSYTTNEVIDDAMEALADLIGE